MNRKLTLLVVVLLATGWYKTLLGQSTVTTGKSNLLSGYSVTVYGGRYTDRHLRAKILKLKPIYYENSWLMSLAVSKQIFDRSDFFRLELETQFAKHIGEQKHYEFNTLLTLRLRYQTASFSFPLSFAVGNGLSYATETPVIEERSRTNVNASRFLNYLLLEIAVDLPILENWEAVGRIHHRSGVFGLYSNVRGGSNIMTVGTRYNF